MRGFLANIAGALALKRDEAPQQATLYSWNVANVVPPRHVRIAILTYTILSSEEKSARTQSDLSLLETSARAARFSSSLGE